jgi:ParB family chromosome partitioning protein
MSEKIDKSIKNLAVDIDTLMPLPGNPRKGNVEAIMASYDEFGQVKPIVVRPNGDGTSTVIAGNHQLEAAKRLGWSKIAVVQYEVDDKQATAFALADNRTNEMGHTDPELLNELLSTITDDYAPFLSELGWDEFELAAIEEQSWRLSNADEIGYTPPEIIDLTPTKPTEAPSVEISEEGNKIVPTGDVDSRSVAATGSTSIGQSGSTKAVVQYTLVFDDADQQKKWYNFIRWLRSDVGYDGDTTSERLMNFIESHADF